MKNNFLRALPVVGVAILAAGISFAVLPVKPVPENTVKALSRLSTVELPAAAADLIAAAPEARRSQVAVETVQAVGALARPGLLPYTVSAISRQNPELAALVAATALEIDPSSGTPIIDAALTAAPQHSTEIVAVLSQRFPGSAQKIKALATQQAPIGSLATGLTGTEPVDQTLQIASLEPQSVSRKGTSTPAPAPAEDAAPVIDHSGPGLPPSTLKSSPVYSAPAGSIAPKTENPPVTLASNSGLQPLPLQPPPTVKPPYTPYISTIETITIENTRVKTPGEGRNYSAP